MPCPIPGAQRDAATEVKAIAGSITQASDRELLPLQAADLLAGQAILEFIEHKPTPLLQALSSQRPIEIFPSFLPYFEELPKIMNATNSWSDAKKILNDLEGHRRKSFP